MQQQINSGKSIKAWRRLGRTFGAIPIIIILYNLLFFLLLNPGDILYEEIKVIVYLLGAAILLYFITWFFEIIGGLLLIIDSIAILIYFIKISPSTKSNSNAIALYSLPFLICGVIAIYCALKERYPSKKSNLKETVSSSTEETPSSTEK